jgi:diguanylate cyclase (GGDEF)-like protein
MPRLLLIARDSAALESWNLPGFTARVLPPDTDLEAGANESEVVVLADPPAAELRRLLGAMEEARGVRPIPVVLAAPPDGPDLVARLRLEGIDGLLDPTWSAALRARCLEITMEHVKIGQQVVEIQRYLLKAARREAKLLHDQTIRDELTGLYNRRHYEDVVRRELSRAERFDQPLSLVFMDFDHLKQINSVYGHRAGSAALEQMGEAIGHSVRAVDLPFRFGGDEFVILLPDTERDGALECAERVRRHLSSTEVRLEHETFRVTASFGVAVYPEDGQTADALLQRADDALFRAKYRGRNCVVVASDER